MRRTTARRSSYMTIELRKKIEEQIHAVADKSYNGNNISAAVKEASDTIMDVVNNYIEERLHDFTDEYSEYDD
jgi:gas vesicle protein